MSKRKILLLYPYYWPFYKAGGPVQSLFNIAGSFGDECEFYLIALNRDIDSKNADESIKTHAWTEGPNHEQIYFVRVITPFIVWNIMKGVNPDTVFINGIFNAQTTLPGLLGAKLLRKRLVISPRGMLQEWGLKRNRILKKMFLAGLRAGIKETENWHATDENEVKDIRRIFGGRQRIHVASNIPRKVSAHKEVAFPDEIGKIRLVFLSLINPNKNLHLVIDAVTALSEHFTLDIYGPIIDKGYWESCQNRFEIGGAVQYKGPVPAWNVPDILARYHFFVLPTEGENFGHAIFDALASGLPVIISRNTPWTEIEARDAGIYIDLGQEGALKTILERLVSLNPTAYGNLRRGSLRYAGDYWKRKDFRTEYSFLID